MHILFIGYGKTSQRIAKQLFQQGHQITTVSTSLKQDEFAQHLTQDIHQLDLSNVAPIDSVYVLVAPRQDSKRTIIENYQHTYVDSVPPILNALAHHPIQRVILVSSTRVYGENQGECIEDDSVIEPVDEQGRLLWQMEQAWRHAYPRALTVVRPTGIYGLSVARMLKLAQTTTSYPNIHWSNRIHIEDLADFLVHLLHVEQIEPSYICSNNTPMPLHEIIRWFQKQLNLPQLTLDSEVEAGKKIYAKRMLNSGFKLKHEQFFKDYQSFL